MIYSQGECNGIHMIFLTPVTFYTTLASISLLLPWKSRCLRCHPGRRVSTRQRLLPKEALASLFNNLRHQHHHVTTAITQR